MCEAIPSAGRDATTRFMGRVLFIGVSSAISGFFLAPAMKQAGGQEDWLGVVFFLGIAAIGFMRMRREMIALAAPEDLSDKDIRKNLTGAVASVFSLGVCALMFGLELSATTVRRDYVYAYFGFGWGIICFVWMFNAHRNIARLVRACS